MNFYLLKICGVTFLLLSFSAVSPPDSSVNFPLLGKIKPRSASEITSSNWSVGAETMDRDYTIYDNWKKYLGPLGVKKARIQAGWAKTEKQKGIYNWRWLDEIIPNMVSQGVEPWVNLSYGNMIYEGGGGETLYVKDLPGTKEALDAWERYVKAIVARYKDYVDEWEVWNEPNYDIDPKKYADFLVLTAKAVKKVQPKAQILGFALGSSVDYKYADKVLGFIDEMGAIHLIDQITYHRNRPIPENNQAVIELEKVLDKYSNQLEARQGEAGCPSEYSEAFAMSGMEWSELTQSKHTLRRMLTDFGRGKQSNIFTIMDAKYERQGKVVWNRKGLLYATEDQKIDHVKPAYYAVQHVTSIFDSSLKTISNYSFSATTDRSLSLYGIKDTTSDKQIVAMWFDGKIASENNNLKDVDFTFYQGDFNTPVYVDMRTGKVYNIPARNWSHKGSVYTFTSIPVYDSPVLIADQSNVPLRKTK